MSSSHILGTVRFDGKRRGPRITTAFARVLANTIWQLPKCGSVPVQWQVDFFAPRQRRTQESGERSQEEDNLQH